jgi:hypothetical protein
MSDMKKYLEDFLESESSGQDMAELAKKFLPVFMVVLQNHKKSSINDLTLSMML